MTLNRTVRFFDRQFQKQIAESGSVLNPFEELALPYLRGRVLDLGCGLGNLSLEAARRGSTVLALDLSPTAVAHLRARATGLRLPIQVEEADLAAYRIDAAYDTVIAVGLLMFLPRSRATALLEDIRAHVNPGGAAVVNVLTEGTTYLEMFEPGDYTLFGENELEESFSGWDVLESRPHRFDAPGSTIKQFATVVARKR